MTQERIHWLDIAKGLLIILVVFGHIFQSLPQYTTACDFIYSFHMPAFFIISGLTLNTTTSFKTFFCKKIKHLMVPYLFFCLYIIGLSIVKTLVGFYPTFPPMFTLDTLLITPSSYFSILWFLPCLFMAEVIFYVISAFSSHYTHFILCVICAFLSLAYIRLGYKPLPFMMNSAFFALPFIWLGTFLSNKVHDNVRTTPPTQKICGLNLSVTFCKCKYPC